MKSLGAHGALQNLSCFSCVFLCICWALFFSAAWHLATLALWILAKMLTHGNSGNCLHRKLVLEVTRWCHTIIWTLSNFQPSALREYAVLQRKCCDYQTSLAERMPNIMGHTDTSPDGLQMVALCCHQWVWMNMFNSIFLDFDSKAL